MLLTNKNCHIYQFRTSNTAWELNFFRIQRYLNVLNILDDVNQLNIGIFSSTTFGKTRYFDGQIGKVFRNTLYAFLTW